MQQKFLEDLQKLYDFITQQKENINKLFEHLENKKFDKLTIIDDFAKSLGLAITDELRVALLTRLINLRDDSLVQVLKKLDKTDTDITKYQELSYIFVKDFYLNQHKEVLNFLEEQNLLTPFYQEIFKGVYSVGVVMSSWQVSWTNLIINSINKELLDKFDGDSSKVMNYLEQNNLFDKGHGGEVADRSYSVLKKDGEGYKSIAYITAFKKEVTEVVNKLENFVDRLIELEDNIYNQKWQYIEYLQKLIIAFSEDKTDKLVSKWADVDRAWMSITTPIQIGHPLEYYEDHFRKAVALEWDIRVTNPSLQNNTQRVIKIKSMFENIYDDIDIKQTYKSIYDFSLLSLDKVQLYLGRAGLFFASEFNGLFSAQVVPNDEIVSKELGKKIFAFSDDILQTQRAKPFLELSKKVFPQWFLKEDREFLFNETKKWHQVYDITTIGHEFGHILWCDDTTEAVMNKTANFKNIEEFKATTGGLVSFFIDSSEDEKELERFVINDTLKRAVGLIAWKEVDEVQPYYCEGLIHLKGLFDSGILDFDDTLTIDKSKENIEKLKQWYIDTYKELAKFYLEKNDATIFLEQFAKKDGKYFKPTDKKIAKFVEYYFELYKQIGQKVDYSVKKEDYIL